MRAELKGMAAVLKLNYRSVLLFELFYRILTLPGYLQAVSRGLEFALSRSGCSYVTAGNLGLFLIQPWTLLWLAGSLLLGLLLLLIELCCLITVYQANAYYRALTPVQIVYSGFKKAASVLRRRSWRLLFLVAADYGLLNLYLIYWILSRVKPVNFVMEELVSQPLGRAGLAALVVLLFLYAVPRLFAFHYCLVEEKSWRDSVADSIDLFRRHWRVLVVSVLAVNVGVILVMFLLRGVCVVVSAVFTALFVSPSTSLAVLTEVCDRITLVILFFTSLLLTVGNLGLLTFLYHRMERRAGGPEWWKGMKVRLPGHLRRRALAVTAVVCGISGFFIFDLAYNGSVFSRDMLGEIQITAHRGSSGGAPENTMAALRLAVEETADYAEIDVQYSKDGVIVVCHDIRLTALAGVDKKVSDLTLAELKELDMGSHFSPEFAGEPMPTLEEVLDYCKGKINLNIEIKNIGKNTDLPEAVAAMIREKDMAGQCVVTSTKLSYLEQVKAADGELKTGYIVPAAYGEYYDNPAIDFISLRASLATRSLVERAHEAGKAVHVWTVNSAKEMEQMKQAGVDNLITDYPALARQILCREEATESLLERIRMMLG